MFKVSFKSVTLVLKGSFMGVSIAFVFIEVIAATRAYGGLVFTNISKLHLFSGFQICATLICRVTNIFWVVTRRGVQNVKIFDMKLALWFFPLHYTSGVTKKNQSYSLCAM